MQHVDLNEGSTADDGNVITTRARSKANARGDDVAEDDVTASFTDPNMKEYVRANQLPLRDQETTSEKQSTRVYLENYENQYGRQFEETLLPLNQNVELPEREKRRRRRMQTASQRKAANMRERRRMSHLNEAFKVLKGHLPEVRERTRMSRIETLKAAMSYIHYLALETEMFDKD